MARKAQTGPYPSGICTIYPPTESKKTWRVRWVQDDHPNERTATSREAAEDLARRAGAQEAKGATLADVERKVSFLAAKYLDTLAHGLYFERQESLLRKWILPVIGSLELDQWTPNQSNAVLRKMREAGIGAARVQNAGQAMRAIITFAQQERWMSRSDDDPMFKVKYTAKATVQGEKPVYVSREGLPTEERVQDFLRAAEKFPKLDRWRTAWELTARSGVRWGELIALRPIDIDFDLRRVSVSRSIEQTSTYKDKEKCTKSGLARSTIFTASMSPRLEELVAITTRDSGALGLLFPGDKRTWATRTTHRNRWVMVAEAAGWPKDPNSDPQVRIQSALWSIHDLRHFAACWMLFDMKADINLVSQWLGHASTSFTLDSYVGHRGDPDKQGHLLTEGW